MKQKKRARANPFPRILNNGDCAVEECVHNFNKKCFNQIPPRTSDNICYDMDETEEETIN